MKNLKKMLIGVCSVAAFGCFTCGAIQMSYDVAADTSAVQEDYFVLGGAVRVNDSRGAGVKFHVAMTETYFDTYGTINADGSGTLDAGVTTGTLLLPTHLTNGNALTVGGEGYAAAVSDSDTSTIWSKQTYGGVDYMQSIVYLYNIPDTDYGTEISVRGYIHTADSYVYTEQVDTISMSAVAEAEYRDSNSQLTDEEKTSLKSTYLDKTVRYHVNGTVTTETLNFKETLINCPTVSPLDDGSVFVGWATKDGEIQKNVTSTLVKNHRDLYAVYQQRFLMTASSFSLKLDNYTSDGYTITAINLGTYDLGANPASLNIPDELKQDKQSHGETTVTVTMTKDGKTLNVNLPVLLVTKEISTKDEFIAAMPTSTDKGAYGYYELTNNIDVTNNSIYPGLGVNDWNSTTGFFGTLDGKNHTISSAANGGSTVFGILRGATIKNVTIKDNYRSDSGLLAKGSAGSTFENVTFYNASGKSYTGNKAWICTAEFSNNTLKNVSVIDTQASGSLFGPKFINNTFDNVTIPSGYAEMGNAPATETAPATSVSYDDVTKVETTKVTLTTRQDFILAGDWSLLDLGDYNGAEIISVKTANDVELGGISSRSAAAKLTDLTKHGEQNFTVTALHNGNRVEITVPVTVITKSIKTMADLQATVKVTSTNNNNIYGYYTLANDVSYTEEGFTPLNGLGGYSSVSAFRGTLDGRGHKITLNATQKNQFTWGIFGVMNGATLKNATIVESNSIQYSARPMLAQNAYDVTIENVNFLIESGTVNYAPIVDENFSNVTMKNVTITSKVDVKYVFNKVVNNTTFENVVIKAIITQGFSQTSTTAPSGVTITVNAEQLENTYNFILGGTTASITLGEGYENATISSFEYDTYSWNATDTIPTALTTDYAKHGENKSLKATVRNNNQTVTLLVPVTVVTKAITTMDELETAVRIHSSTETKNGYYILANDVTGMWAQAANGQWNATGGFIGTLNGNGKKISWSTNNNLAANGLFGIFKGSLKNVTLEAKDANNYSQTILAAVSNGSLENVQISIVAMNSSDATRAYKNQTTGALTGNITNGSWKNVTIDCDTEINGLFGANLQTVTFESCVLNVPAYNNFVYGKDTAVAAGWTINLTGKNTNITDTTTQVIDLGITDGNLNTTQTYTLQVEGLSTQNFISASYNGSPLTTSGLTFNVSQLGKTYGEDELTIEYWYNTEKKTHKLPILMVTKLLSTKEDLQNFATYADAYDGVTNNDVYDGYFALGADIAMNGSAYTAFDSLMNKTTNASIGFRGVFDGRGHSIDRMSLTTSSAFVGILHKDGIVKNVAFTDVPVGGMNASLIANWGGGLVENVFIGYTGAGQYSQNSVANSAYTANAYAVRFHNCVITYDTDWKTSGNVFQAYILGRVNVSANAYKNVYIVAKNNAQANIVNYYDDAVDGEVPSKTPKGDDNFALYDNASDFLSEHKNEISAWDFFTVGDSGVSFGGKNVLTATTTAKTFTGDTLISANKTSSDYVIVYEDGNDNALNAATFIAEHIQRATGTVAYTANGGMFKETVTGGVRLPITTKIPATWSQNSAYIFIGNTEIDGAPTAAEGKYIVKKQGNSVFIHADNDIEYITAATAFLEEAIGYKALSDDTVYYEKVNSSKVSIGALNIEYDSAFNVRTSTNTFHTWKNDQLALNGRSVFTVGPNDDNGKSQAFHNSIYWLNYLDNLTAHPTWFRKIDDSKDHSSANTDICYAAGGAQNDSNTEYVAMVAYAATQMRNALIANPGVNKLTFSIMDNDLTGCTCSVCSEDRTNAQITFLNAVVAKILELDTANGISDRDFTIFVLAYHYVLAAPTVNMNEHLGVIYAPIGASYEAKSIYDNSNNNVRTQISGWAAKTKNIGFWFYGSLYHNYMLFNDTFESMLTWFEYAARTVKTAGGEPVWVYVNGQTRPQGATAFESFKQYAFAKAQVEILKKVTVDGSNANYTTQIQAYLTELEGEFFGFTVDEDGVKTFKNGGYYGAAAANQAMYELYSQMRTDYKNINDGIASGENPYKSNAYIGQLKYNKTLGTGTYNRVCDYVASKDTKNVYWDYYTKSMISGYMEKITAAQTANTNAGTSLGALQAVYVRHVLLESLSPRFMICVAGKSSYSNYGFSGGYNGTSIADMKLDLQEDFALLGFTYYGEHYLLSDLYNKW